MSILNILRYPDPRLHKVAKPVSVFDDRIKQLAADIDLAIKDLRDRLSKDLGAQEVEVAA